MEKSEEPMLKEVLQEKIIMEREGKKEYDRRDETN